MKFGEVGAAVNAGRPVLVPDGFRETFEKAVKQARDKREIGLFQYWRLNAAARNPRQLSRIYAGVMDEAVATGYVSSNDEEVGFDWDALLAFIERLIDLILRLFV